MHLKITAIAAALVLTPTAAPAREAPPSQATEHLIAFGTSYALKSTVLNDTRELNVWLPTGYEKSQDRYPVVYVLDGGMDQDFTHVAALGSLASLSWTFGPFIVVGIQTRDRRAELTTRPTDERYLAAFPESGGADRFRQFLKQEAVPFVESRFRTGERKALMGESLAGLFVVDTMLNDPTLFNDYVAVSPSLWWDDRRPLQDLQHSAKLGPLSKARFYLAAADEGGTMQDGIDRLRSFLKTQPPGRITVRYADFSKTATHSTVYHRAAEDALRWLYPAPPYPADATPWFMIEGASPPAKAPAP